MAKKVDTDCDHGHKTMITCLYAYDATCRWNPSRFGGLPHDQMIVIATRVYDQQKQTSRIQGPSISHTACFVKADDLMHIFVDVVLIIRIHDGDGSIISCFSVTATISTLCQVQCRRYLAGSKGGTISIYRYTKDAARNVVEVPPNRSDRELLPRSRDEEEG
jgi:exosome complex RNA-binding protein Rrp42 (RNase PH superfamily)